MIDREIHISCFRFSNIDSVRDWLEWLGLETITWHDGQILICKRRVTKFVYMKKTLWSNVEKFVASIHDCLVFYCKKEEQKRPDKMDCDQKMARVAKYKPKNVPLIQIQSYLLFR